MADESISYPLDLICTPLFRKMYNISYFDDDFDGTDDFWEVVFISACPNNIGDCVSEQGALLTSGITVELREDIPLLLVEEDDYNCHVKIADTVEIDLNDDIDIKAIFIVSKNTDFVLLYMINETAMRFCDKMVFEEGNVLIRYVG